MTLCHTTFELAAVSKTIMDVDDSKGLHAATVFSASISGAS